MASAELLDLEKLLKHIHAELEKVLVEESVRLCESEARRVIEDVKKIAEVFESTCKSLGGKASGQVLYMRPFVEVLLTCELPKPTQVRVELGYSAGELRLLVGPAVGEAHAMSMSLKQRPRVSISAESAYPDFTLSVDRELDYSSVETAQKLTLVMRFNPQTRSLTEVSLSVSGVKTKKLQVRV